MQRIRERVRCFHFQTPREGRSMATMYTFWLILIIIGIWAIQP
jgi:hypothetical protein